MSISELGGFPERTASLRDVEKDTDWYTLMYWPRSRDCEPRPMLALHRTTGECYIDWATIEHAADDVANQARYLAQAMLAIREQTSAAYSGARDRQLRVRAE